MEPSASGTRPNRVLSVPNGLSLSRLLLVGVAVAMLFDGNHRVLAVTLLAIAGVTDFVDGYVARRFDQVTTLGAMLDPTVDRFVLGTSVIAGIVYGAIPLWFGVVALVREFLVSAMAIGLAAVGGARLDVLFIGKVATFGFLVSFPLFFFGHATGAFAHGTSVAAWVIAVPSLVLAFVSIGAYAPAARAAFVGGRASRASAEAGVGGA